MKPTIRLVLLLSIAALMWALPSAADVRLAGRRYSETGAITGAGIFGSVHYDAENKVLTLDNAHLRYHETVLFNGDEDLRLVVKGDCSITVDNTATYPALVTNSPMTFAGGGTLQIDTPGVGLLLNVCAAFTIGIEDCTLVVHGGTYGIKGCTMGTLAIRNATVKARGGTNTYSFAIGHWGHIRLKDCKIIEPSGALIGVYEGEKVILDGSGKAAAEVSIIPALSSIAPTTAAATATQEIYSLDGRRQTTLRPGVNLLHMGDGTLRKVMVPAR